MEQMTLFGKPDKIDSRFADYEQKIEHAKAVLCLAAEISETYYKHPLVVAYSGGKDSDVLLDIAMQSGIDFEVLHSITTVDAPETNRHVNQVYERLRQNGIKCYKKPPVYKGEKTNMWKLIERKLMPPTRFSRYCCSVLKEASSPNRIVSLGVRGSESTGRGGRDDFGSIGHSRADSMFFSLDHARQVFDDARHTAQQYGKRIEEEDVYDCTMVKFAKKNKELTRNPIYDFTDIEIWRYIKQNQVPVNPLYEKGFKRIGCIGCPLGDIHKRRWEMSQYPYIKQQYIDAFDKMLARRRDKGKDDTEGEEGFRRWSSGQDVYDWWMSDPRNDFYGQMTLQ